MCMYIQSQFSLSVPHREWFTCVVEKKEQREGEDRSFSPLSYQHLLEIPPKLTSWLQHGHPINTHTHPHRDRERESHKLEQRRELRQSEPSASLHYAQRNHTEHNPHRRHRAHTKSCEGTGFKESLCGFCASGELWGCASRSCCCSALFTQETRTNSPRSRWVTTHFTITL